MAVRRYRGGVPFTFLPHQVPVLPLLGRTRRDGHALWPWDGVALVIGSMAPDFFYVTNGWGFGPWGIPMWFDGHRAAHLPAVVIVAVLVTWVVRRIVLAVLPLCLPASGPLGARAYWFSSLRRPRLRWTVLSAAFGAASHLILDAFTHPDGAVVRAVGALQTTWFTIGSHNVTAATMLQYGGSVIGGIVALVMLGHLAGSGYLERDVRGRSLPKLAPIGQGLAWGSVVLGAVAGGLYAWSRAGTHQVGDNVFVSGTSIVVFAFCWAAGLVIAAGCFVARRYVLDTLAVNEQAEQADQADAFP